jgi:quercetin dioxygenase-like cupin family protein
MSHHRVFAAADHMQVAKGEPIRSVIVESSYCVIVAWHVEPGQVIAAHVHPAGDDAWTILSGTGDYQVDASGGTVPICPGDVVLARSGQVHGVRCTSDVPLRFVSVVSPLQAGYEPLSGAH